MSTAHSIPDPHFGTDEQMLAWAARAGLTIVKDAEGQHDWEAVYTEWSTREDLAQPS